MTSTAARVDIEGIVQGVGFRPFLHGLALELELAGWIVNRGNAGVSLHVEGDGGDVQAFIKGITTRNPPVSRVDDVRVAPAAVEGHHIMVIRPSDEGKGPTIVLPADIATCDECLADLRGNGPGGTGNKYHGYPFVACAACGPRFTTVVDLPYDRIRTTMVDFPLCERDDHPCITEYRNERDRRFHAQTFACPRCGPHYDLANPDGHVLSREGSAFSQAAMHLSRGAILAMKGIGGVHLVVDATRDAPIEALRSRKGDRRFKPLAVMAPGIDTVRAHARVSSTEAAWLASHRRPIVLLERRHDTGLSSLVSPGLSTTGFMLPYMGAHHLLLDACKQHGVEMLVMTSGNVSGLPMAITNKDVLAQLAGIADSFLLHDRRIHQRCDDSVGKVIDDTLVLVRRSRGFVPEYIPAPVTTGDRVVIATGPELHATAAILKGNKLFPTQYIGDVQNVETQAFMEATIEHFSSLLHLDDTEVAAIACDAHPLFLTSTLAADLATSKHVPLVPVYHHHAHCASLVVDTRMDVDEEGVFVICDGVGYGEDKHAWGGEIFSGSLLALHRDAHLAWRKLPGGDTCVKHPARVLASILGSTMDPPELGEFMATRFSSAFPGGTREQAIVLRQLSDGRPLPVTSSTGRVLDAFSCLLGTCTTGTYEGEPAMRLEGLGMAVDDASIEPLVKEYLGVFSTTGTAPVQLDVAGGFSLAIDAMNDTFSHPDRPKHARAFQAALGMFLGAEAARIAIDRGITSVAFGGGVACNRIVHAWMKEAVTARGLRFLHHSSLPPGDGGLAAGQACMGWLRVR